MLSRILFSLTFLLAAFNVGAAPVCVDAEGLRLTDAQTK